MASQNVSTTPVVPTILLIRRAVLNVFFARSLTSHLPATSPVVVNSVNPGFCHHSALMRDVPYALYLFTMLTGLAIGRKTSEGAKTIVWSALAGHDDPVIRENLRGAYTENCELAEPSDFVLSKEGQDMENRIWVSAFVRSKKSTLMTVLSG
jgi:retinol dehydrogenase 12